MANDETWRRPGEVWIDLWDIPEALAQGYRLGEWLEWSEHGWRRVPFKIPGSMAERRAAASAAASDGGQE